MVECVTQSRDGGSSPATPLQFSPTTPCMMIRPEAVCVLPVSSKTIVEYQRQMSKAVWRPAPGRRFGFLVLHDRTLLGLIYLASPVIGMAARDQYLFPIREKGFQRGKALRQYMDMSVCVAAQPVGWYWNIGKLLALLAPTFGDYVEARYPNDKFKGVTTTSLWGKSVQYNRIYKYLGNTKGWGHAHVDNDAYHRMVARLKELCPHCHENPIEDYYAITTPSKRRWANLKERGVEQDYSKLCLLPFDIKTNVRIKRIETYNRVTGDKTLTSVHGDVRGIYYHPATPSEQRQSVIQAWFDRWGLPRYLRVKDQKPPYEDGFGGRPATGNAVNQTDEPDEFDLAFTRQGV